MRNVLFLSFAILFFTGCSQKKDKKQGGKKVENNEYTVSKDGIGELKIGLTRQQLEKILKQQLSMKHEGDAEAWADTATTKYRDIEVTLYFERYTDDNEAPAMQLTAVKTSSALCKTESGLGIGDEKTAIINAYDDNPVDMGPEYEQVNDSTWAPSKIKYNINIKDDKWDRQLIFQLVNKKVASVGASIIMGE